MKHSVRTRFAPSPTGLLHIGGLRTALYAYAWAKRHGGTFILRIEDTDRERYVPEAVEQIVRSLQWVGLQPDEGVIDFQEGKPIERGGAGPYVQSARLDLYTKFAQRLLEQGKAYECFCTPERLEQMRAVQIASKQMPKYDRHCYALSPEEKAALKQNGVPRVLRFYTPDGGPIAWDDAVFGRIQFERDQMDDFVMMKADGFPTYNFANVVDDHSMGITHVIRAYEFLSSTPKHLLLYEAFGVPAPVFAHGSHILGKDKKKLSKRHAAVSVDEYRKLGYLPQALLNFIALLGWTHPEQKEVFNLEEFTRVFDIEAMHKTGAVFDTEKSLWMNGQYIRQLPVDEFLAASLPFLEDAGLVRATGDQYENLLSKKSLSKKMLQDILATEQARVKQLSEVPESVRFFFEPELSYDPNLLLWKKMTKGEAAPSLQAVVKALESVNDDSWTAESIQRACEQAVQQSGVSVGAIFWPFRVALTGREKSPSPQDVAAVLGKEETLKRLRAALAAAIKMQL